MADDPGRGRPPRDDSSFWTPRPDPTVLTTEAVERATEVFRREIAALREIVEAQLASVDRTLENRRREFSGDLASARALIEQRLDGMDKAIELAAHELAKFAALIRQEWKQQAISEREYVLALIDNVRSVSAERLAKIDSQFQASEKAVDAAFAAAKEAVSEQNKANTAAIGKSEAATKEQLASLSRVTDAGLAGLEDKIADARERLTAIESLTRGIEQASGEGRDARTDQRASLGTVIAAVATLVAVISFVLYVVKK